MTRKNQQLASSLLPKVGMFLLFVCTATIAQSQQCNCGGPSTTVNLWTDDFGTGGRVPSPNVTLCYEDGTAATNCGANWEINDGDYTLHNTTAGVVTWPTWSVTTDHTGGGLGRMMIVNASNQGQAFYTIQLPVQPGCDIDVSFWVKNVIKVGVANHIAPDITLQLLDTLGGIISSINTGPVPQDEQWYQYSLSVNPGVNSAVQISLINNLPPGNGNDFVLDDISMNQTYNVGPTGDFTFQIDCSGLTTFTSTASSFATGYAWDFDNDGVIDDASPNPSFTYPGPGSYLATLTVDDGFCSYALTDTVIVSSPQHAGCIIEIPNVFSPNADGQNDTFVIQGISETKNVVRIYNRWGKLIFEKANYRNTWRAEGFSDGTYYYEIVVEGKPEPFTGHLTILR